MNTPTPTRITIELHPGTDGSGWTAETRVHEADPAQNGPQLFPSDAEPGRPAAATWAPPSYEEAACTCHEGLCDRDHGNE